MKLFNFNRQTPLNLAVMASGRGSNFDAIWDAINMGKLNASINLLISDKPDAKALASAVNKGIPTRIFPRKNYASHQDFEEAIITTLKANKPDLIVLAGYMRILGKPFIDAFESSIINIHPALLPAFPGLHAQKQALDYGVKVTGCTVHFVDSGMDTGPIILQKTVPVLTDDTEESLSIRILKEEHDTYWRAIKLLADGKVVLIDRKVIIK